MEPHRPRRYESVADGSDDRPAKPKRADALPLDVHWLEREALRYVARAEATQYGVESMLRRKLRERCERTGESPESIEHRIPDVVLELVDKGYVDDRRLAEHLYDRARRQGRSQAQIRAQLQKKGVDGALIEAIEAERVETRNEADPSDEYRREATSEDEELEAAFRAARKRRIGPYCADPEERAERRERHLGVLARQGFSRDIAYRVIDAELRADDSEHGR